MSEHKLRKIAELNSRLKDQLELPRIPVSQASESLIAYMNNTKDYLLPSVWGPPPHDPFASQTTGGCGCSVMHYAKHASLVERCYPAERADDAVPSSNELSYLVYYAQSKPAKLTKVGAHLSRRIARDAQRRRRADVVVGLLIFDALLGACGRDLNFFARDVLDSLDAALAADDPELAPAATRTFARFCRNHSGATFAIDSALRSLYARLIRAFAAFTQPGESAARVGLGLCALQAIADSSATYAGDGGEGLPLAVGAVVARIATAPEPAAATAPDTDPAALDAIEQQIASIVQAETPPTDVQLGCWAWRCIGTLVRRPHSQHSRAVVAEILRQLDTSLCWRPVPLCVRIATSSVAQLQPHDQNMVIVKILTFLADGALSEPLFLRALPHNKPLPAVATAAVDAVGRDNSNENNHGDDDDDDDDDSSIGRRRTCLIRILEHLFCEPHVLVGVSAMEALSVLVAILVESAVDEDPARPDQAMLAAALRAASGASRNASPDAASQPDEMTNNYHLLAAIGGLARHQYYAGQLLDMVSFLVLQMALGADPPAEPRSAATRGRLEWLLRALYVTLRVSQPESAAAADSALTLDAIAPLFTLLLDESPACRALAVDCIAEALHHIRPQAHRTETVQAMYAKLAAVLRDTHDCPPQHQPAGYAGAASVLCALLGVLEASGVAHTLALVRDAAPKHASGLWVTLLATVWAEAAAQRGSSGLASLTASVAADARREGLWEEAIADAAQLRTAGTSSDQAAAGDRPAAGVAAASGLAERLGCAPVAALLGTDAAPVLSAADAAAVDRVLCDAGGTRADSPCPPTAADQAKDIRARVSVDWEMQIRHDAVAAPHVSVDQLRATLWSGLALHAGDRSPPAAASLRAGHAQDALDAVAGRSAGRDGDRRWAPDAPPQPVPDEVRRLLDSIGGDVASGLERAGPIA